MRSAYGYHDTGCTCTGCTETAELLSDFSTKWTPVSASVLDDYLDQVYTQRIGATDVHEGLWKEYFTKYRQFTEAGYARRLHEPANVQEFELFRKMERNLASFAAHKQAVLTDELRALMIDKAGNKRSFYDWKQEATTILGLHNKAWLRTEATHATIAAQQIEQWQEIQRRKDMYPYLRYETAGDDRVRPKHKLLDQAVHPVDSEFWDVNYPPNGWKCRCKVIQVDEPGLEMQVNFSPDKGFKHNVGKTGLIVGEDHPYFDWDVLDTQRLTSQAHTLLTALDAATMLQSAVQRFAGKVLPLPQVPGADVQITEDNLRRIAAQPHAMPDVRDKMLPALDVLLPALRLDSQANGAGDVAAIYHLIIELLGGPSFFQVALDADDVRRLISITSTR